MRAREQGGGSDPALLLLLCQESLLLSFIMEQFSSFCASEEQTRLTEQGLQWGVAAYLHNFPLPENVSQQWGVYSAGKQIGSGDAQTFQLNHP